MHKELKNLIDKSEYVSFDVFDTAIQRKRLFRPADLFKFIERRIDRVYGLVLIENFTKERISAERQSRKIFADQEEITLSQIYSCFQDNLGLTDEMTEKIREIEIKTEKRFCRKNDFIFDIYSYCEGRRVIFLSDMYLPKSCVEEILLENGYKEYYKLFISSETGLTKFSGRQYGHLLEELDVSADKILHIGDNFATDVQNAQKAGINTYFYNSSEKKNSCYLKHPATRQKVNTFIKNANGKKIVFYGAGLFVKEFVKQYDLSDLNVLGFVDMDSSKEKIGNYKIFQPKDIKKLNPDIIVVTILQTERVIEFLNDFRVEEGLNFEVCDLFGGTND